MGPKKGVIMQSVKDVVQSLVDDDLVFKDKIGTSVSKLIRWSMEHVIFVLSSMAMHNMVICLHMFLWQFVNFDLIPLLS